MLNHVYVASALHSDQHSIAVVECELSARESTSYAIYAMNAVPHLTHLIRADLWMRQKIAQVAENEGLQPIQICDRYCSPLSAA